jgi:hypothetical protein
LKEILIKENVFVRQDILRFKLNFAKNVMIHVKNVLWWLIIAQHATLLYSELNGIIIAFVRKDIFKIHHFYVNNAIFHAKIVIV